MAMDIAYPVDPVANFRSTGPGLQLLGRYPYRVRHHSAALAEGTIRSGRAVLGPSSPSSLR